MADEQEVEQTEVEPQVEAQAEQAPWEKEGVDFDAEKAWKLVQNLREENKGLKAKNREYEDAQMSEREKADRDLAETRAEIERLTLEKTRAEIRAKYPILTDEDMEFLGAGNPDDLTQRAARLVARLEVQEPDKDRMYEPMRRKPQGGLDPTAKSKQTDFIREALMHSR